MMRVYFAILFLLLSAMSESLLYAQSGPYRRVNRVPIYRSRQDSIRLYEIDKQIADIRNKTSVNGKTLDSLVLLYEKQYAYAIKGFRNIYLPARDHISLDSVLKLQDRSTVTKVSIRDFTPAVLPEVILECHNIESLELINTNIRVLPRFLNDLPRLKSIRIYNPMAKRRIKLRRNDKVSTLVIRGDHPRRLPRNFRRYNALEVLDLSGNNLKRFPNGASRNPHLRELNLKNNALTLRGRIEKHPTVETLALQHNAIKRVPRAIGKFQNLTKLNFNYNRIRSAHPAIGSLRNLEHLSFYRNELKSIPTGVYALKNLREIDLFYNQIAEVHPEIQELRNLESLYLSHNQLTFLPDAIGNLSSLEGLYVWNNYLEAIPGQLGRIRTLRFLWVNNNFLKMLPASLFELDQIEELDVSHNELREIPESVFDYPSLRILSLMDNPWTESCLQVIWRRGEALRSRDVFVHLPDK